MKKDYLVSIIVPVFNEEVSIAPFMKELDRALSLFMITSRSSLSTTAAGTIRLPRSIRSSRLTGASRW